jgi:hypothetical protein
MAKGFTNRKGKTYFIKKRKTKTGKTSYTMTLKESKDCVDEEPKGYEVHELPENGQLVIRKKIPMVYNLKEVHIIKSTLKKNETISDFKLDIRGEEIIIYISEISELDFLSGFGGLLGNKIGLIKNYEARMKLIKTDNETDRYAIQRFCYRGSIDDWITIGISTNLSKLAEKYIYHLGKESYFELGYNFGE